MAGEIFISYRRADAAWARLLHERLRAEGVEAWYDAQVGAGQDWRIATAKALEASQIFVLLFSENAAQSSDIAKELAAATLEKKLIIPVRLQNIAPKGAFLYELASRNWVNAYENTEAKLAELAKGLAHLVQTGARDESVLPFDRGHETSARVRRTWMPALIATGLLVMAVAGAGFYWTKMRPVAAPALASPPPTRIAVLPFDTLGGNAAQTFAKTVAEQIIATLNDLQVQTVSRDDAAALDGPGREAAAAKLGAEFILDGSVQSGEKGLRVTMHLNHVTSHATVWTESYDQNGAGALEFQSQIAAVASDIATQALAARRDDPTEIDDAVLGLLLKTAAGIHTMTQDSFLMQRTLAQQVVARAPHYARSYSLLAMVSGLLTYSASPDDLPQLRADAKRAAGQALALNPKDGRAYLALGISVPPGHWVEQEAIYRRGLAVAPNDATLQTYVAELLTNVGRLRDALVWSKTSLALDPQSPPKNSALAMLLAENGHVGEAVSTIDRAAKIWPSNITVWVYRFNILANFGHAVDARAMLDATETIPLGLEPPAVGARRAYLDALKAGTPAAKAAAVKAIRAAMAAADTEPAQDMQMLAGIGDVDGAFDKAKSLYAFGESRQTPISTTPLFQSVTGAMRRDPRFMALVAGAGLAEYWQATGKWPDFCSEGLPYDCQAMAKGLAPAPAHSGR